VQFLRRAGERQMAGDRFEYTELAERQAAHKTISKIIWFLS
jgi:hypothetical protein